MFETLGKLFTIAIWVAAVFLFGGGLFLCSINLFTGKGWEKFWSVVAIILGIIAFFKLYSWLDSIVWCLLLTGVVLCVVGTLGSDEPHTTPKEKKYGLGDAILDTYCEYELQKQATKAAIRELDEGR